MEWVRWQRRLDAIIDRCTEGSSKRVKPAVRDILRVALYQIVCPGKIPSHAAVNEAVNQARRRFAAGPAGFVNAVLRNALRNRAAVDPAVTDDPRSLAIHFSHPDWLVHRWIREIGIDEARRVLAHNNTRASVDLRVNSLRTAVNELVEALERTSHVCTPSALVPAAVRLDGVHGPIQSLPGYGEGLFAVQDLASQMIAPLLKPLPDHRILDACAAPGGKTAHVAALTQNRSKQIVAVDCDAVRVEEMAENLRRLGVERVDLRVGDSQDGNFIKGLGTFDRILVDAPCTGLGVLRHNPESKYRLQEDDLAAFGARQLLLLTAAAQALDRGGLLLYSVCTVSREETWDVIDRFLRTHRDYSLDPIDPEEVPVPQLADKARNLQLFSSPGCSSDGWFFRSAYSSRCLAPRARTFSSAYIVRDVSLLSVRSPLAMEVMGGIVCNTEHLGLSVNKRGSETYRLLGCKTRF